MEKYSNSRPGYNTMIGRGIVVLLLIAMVQQSRAQTYFNRLYPNHSRAMMFMATCPQGSSGFMAAAMVIDSTTGKDGLRFFRFDAEGREQASAFFAIPRFKDRYFVLFPNCMTRTNDNSFVVLSQVQSDAGEAPIAALMMIDSNAQVVKYRELYNPHPGPADSFMYSSGVGFDGQYIVTMHGTETAVGHSNPMLMKFDTGLNMIWSKTYSPGIYNFRLAGSLCVGRDGYAIAGSSGNFKWDDDTAYRAQTVVVKTDTGGALLWEYRCPEFISAGSGCIVQTADGGYVFAAKGDAYFERTAFKSYVGQDKLYKLDGFGKQQWAKVLRPKFNTMMVTSSQLVSDEYIGFRTFSPEEDTVGDFWIGYLDTRLYDTLGNLIKKQKYYSPYVRDTTFRVRLGFYGPAYTADGHALVAGYYEDYSGRVISPQQQGWIIKLDTNGCLGPLDSFCAPVSVSEQQLPAPAACVYPNPASGMVYLNLDEPAQGLWLISDLQGRVIQTVTLTSARNAYSCTLSGAAAGLYYYRVLTAEGRQLSAGKLMYQP